MPPEAPSQPAARDACAPSFFFGRVISCDVVGAADPPRRREKSVPIIPAHVVSQHVVDLTPPAPPAGRQTRTAEKPGDDFEQRLALFSHAVKRTLNASTAEDYRRWFPKRPDRGSAVVSPLPLLKVPFIAISTAMKNAFEHAASLKKTERRESSRVATLPGASPERVREPKDPFLKLSLPIRWHRHAAVFALVAMVVALPLHLLATYSGLIGDKNAVAAGVETAVYELKNAGTGALALNPGSAAAFDRAAASFAQAHKRLESVTIRLGALISGNGEKLSGGSRLLQAGEALAKTGSEITAAFDALDAAPERSVTDRTKTLIAALAAAAPHLESAVEQLDEISPRTVPEPYRPAFEAIRGDLRSVSRDTSRFLDASETILTILGTGGKRRYLVVFQNANELRPTGGFIGSFALMDVKDGRIVGMEIPAGGSYDLRGGLNELVAAPDQLRLVNTRWEFQDANWFADFPASARALTWFYEKSGGPTVDGVIAVTSRLMEKLLDVVGPIDMPEYGKTVTAGNFSLETQKAVEIEYDRAANRPKQIISDMAPKLLQKLTDGGSAKLLPLAASLSLALSEKDVLTYFRNEDEQQSASELGWTGELRPTAGADFLAVVDANIAGGKTDGVVEADIRHETAVGEDGSLVDTVTVRRTHRGVTGDAFTGIKNIDYVRFYVPAGSELISAEGFEAPGAGYFRVSDVPLKPSTLLAAAEGAARTHQSSGTRITEESGLTVFGNWVQLEPGESRAVKISYRLPFTLQDLTKRPESRFDRLKNFVGAYPATAGLKLTVRKQPGAVRRTFSTLIRTPRGWRVVSRVPAEAGLGGEGLTYAGPLERDLYVGMILSKER